MKQTIFNGVDVCLISNKMFSSFFKMFYELTDSEKYWAWKKKTQKKESRSYSSIFICQRFYSPMPNICSEIPSKKLPKIKQTIFNWVDVCLIFNNMFFSFFKKFYELTDSEKKWFWTDICWAFKDTDREINTQKKESRSYSSIFICQRF